MTSPVESPVPAEPSAAGAGHALLTPREEVALLARAVDLPAEVAARRLKISARTLRRFQARAVAKVGARGPVQAAVLAAAAGLIDVRQVRVGALPAWPSERSSASGRTGAAALAPARAAQAEKVRARRARFAELRAEGLSVAGAGRAMRVSSSTATSYERERKRAGSG